MMWYIILPGQPLRMIGNLRQTKEYAVKLSNAYETFEISLFSFESKFNYVYDKSLNKFRRVRKFRKKTKELQNKGYDIYLSTTCAHLSRYIRHK